MLLGFLKTVVSSLSNHTYTHLDTPIRIPGLVSMLLPDYRILLRSPYEYSQVLMVYIKEDYHPCMYYYTLYKVY